MATRVDTLEPIPIPAPERPPERKLSPAEWAKKNLFSTWYNGVLTVGFGLLLGWAAFRVLQFVFVDARWEIIERNLRLLLVFRFPREETWRLWTALAVLAASVGLGAGAAAKLRAAEVAEGRAAPPARYLAVRRVAPPGSAPEALPGLPPPRPRAASRPHRRRARRTPRERRGPSTAATSPRAGNGRRGAAAGCAR